MRRPAFRYWGILLLLFAAGAINYIDRQTLSVLKPLVKSSLGTGEPGYALLVNLFTFCYAGAYIGSGWIVDRIGARRGLVLFIAVWSAATIGCGFATTFVAFAVCRALLGLAEPGNQPVAIRALTLWVPPVRRGLVMSLVGAGSTVGSISAAPIVAWLATETGWKGAFVVPGAVGLVVGGVWWAVYRHPSVPGQPEAALGISASASGVGQGWAGSARSAGSAHVLESEGRLPWLQLWRQRSLWGIVLARFVSDPVWYYCLFWMPGYFQEQRGLSLAETGRIGWIPFLAAAVGGISMAALSDRVGQRLGNAMRGRIRLLGILALFGPAAMFVPRTTDLGITLALLCVVAVVCMAWLSILGPLVADVFPAGNVGGVWGIAGAFGALGAILFNYEVGRISSNLGAANMFFILGALHLIAFGILSVLVRKVSIEPACAAEI